MRMAVWDQRRHAEHKVLRERLSSFVMNIYCLFALDSKLS